MRIVHPHEQRVESPPRLLGKLPNALDDRYKSALSAWLALLIGRVLVTYIEGRALGGESAR